MRLAAIALALAITILPASASAEHRTISSYGSWRFRDAMVEADGLKFSIYLHPKDNAVLIQPAMSEITSGKALHLPIETWRRAAETFVSPVGCGVQSVDVVSLKGATWEADIVCPDDVDLHALVKEQREALKRGEALHKD